MTRGKLSNREIERKSGGMTGKKFFEKIDWCMIKYISKNNFCKSIVYG